MKTKQTIKAGNERDIIMEAEKGIKIKKIERKITGLKPNTSYNVRSKHLGTSVLSKGIVSPEEAKKIFPEIPHEKIDEHWKTVGGNKFVESYTHFLQENYPMIVLEDPFLWEVTDSYGYSMAEASANKAFKLNLSVQGHCAFWAKKCHLPERLRNSSESAVKEALMGSINSAGRIEKVLADRRIKRWVLVNEPLQHTERIVDGVNRNELAIEPTNIDFYKDLFRKARELRPDAELIVNEYDILSGELIQNYLDYINNLLRASIRPDYIGVQCHIDSPDRYTLPTIRDSLDLFSEISIPIIITELDFPHNNSEKAATYLRNVLKILLGHPNVEYVYFWGISANMHWLEKEGKNSFGLYNWDEQTGNNPNIAGSEIEEFLEEISVNENAESDDNGEIITKGLKGAYIVTDLQTGDRKTLVI